MSTEPSNMTSATPEGIFALDITLGVSYLICSLIGVTGNIVSGLYFWDGRCELSSIYLCLYRCITALDCAVSAMIIPCAVAFLKERRYWLLENPLFCQWYGQIWDFISRLSVFLVVEMTLIRAVVIARPFYRVNKTALFTFNVCFVTFGASCYAYLAETGRLLVRLNFLHETCVTYLHVPAPAFYSFILLFYFLPFFTVIVSCVVSVTTLLLKRLSRTNKVQVQVGKRQNPYRTASWTVVLFGVMYVVINTPYTLYLVFLAVKGVSQVLVSPIVNAYVFHYCYCTSVIVNSALNPILYGWRMKGLRRFVVTFREDVVRSLSRSGDRELQGRY